MRTSAVVFGKHKKILYDIDVLAERKRKFMSQHEKFIQEFYYWVHNEFKRLEWSNTLNIAISIILLCNVNV